MLSPNLRLNRRTPADAHRKPGSDLAGGESLAMVRCAVHQPYPTTRTAYHFRTPSPCRQLKVFFKLPTSFLSHNTLIQQSFAAFSTSAELSLKIRWPMSCDEAVKKPNQRGNEQCIRKHGHWPLRPAARLPLVETPSQSKRLSAQAEVRPQQLSWTENHSLEPLLVQQVTCCIAKQTQASATDRVARSKNLNHQNLRFGVLRRARVLRPAERAVASPDIQPSTLVMTAKATRFADPVHTAQPHECTRRYRRWSRCRPRDYSLKSNGYSKLSTWDDAALYSHARRCAELCALLPEYASVMHILMKDAGHSKSWRSISIKGPFHV